MKWLIAGLLSGIALATLLLLKPAIDLYLWVVSQRPDPLARCAECGKLRVNVRHDYPVHPAIADLAHAFVEP